MNSCPSCERPVPPGQRFCGSCGRDLEVSSAETASVTAPANVRARSGGSQDHRFLPGVVIAQRYRILGLVGRGGMGEVYRAEDLKLRESVALKFLPEEFRSDSARLERLFQEVKLARQVAHPNVCRMYDVGEVDGQPFLSMEFVDGEDGASLLRRIGRLPQDKAVQIARQLCAGLAAAHERGVLHCDLKPSNLMIDGRGRARITDFGLAVLGEFADQDDPRAGTPAYMAPEQLAGEAVSVKSDLYSLGLVLYELFTGKRPYAGSTREEISKVQRESSPTTPTTHVEELDPAVERVILRCLEVDPAERPSSALAIAAALPGGDPLAAALAAGETPSPEMVAAAGGAGVLRPAAGVALLAVVLLGLALLGVTRNVTSLIGRSAEPKPPEVLEERARELLSAIGHDEPAAHSARGYRYNADYILSIAKNDSTPDRWLALADEVPPALLFWYRESPRPFLRARAIERVGPKPPAPASYTTAGTADVLLDGQGRLQRLSIVPPDVDSVTAPAEEPDWATLLRFAGLMDSTLQETKPVWIPPVYADARFAWTGPLPNAPNINLRVEAASIAGSPVYFEVVSPWSEPDRALFGGAEPFDPIDVLFWITFSVGLVLAWRNVRRGRGDRRGALRVAMFLAAVSLTVGLLRGYEERDLYAGVFDDGFSAWVFYMALEPLVRRRWPESITSWSRLLAGRFRDPLIGRDILVGAAVGTVTAVVYRLPLLAGPFGPPAPMPHAESLSILIGPAQVLADLLERQSWIVIGALFALVLVALLRLLLRRSWLTYAVLFAGVTLIEVLSQDRGDPALWVTVAVANALLLGTLARFGLLALAAVDLFSGMTGAPVLNFSLWYASSSLLLLVAPVALVIYAFYLSVGRGLARRDA